MTGIAKTKKIFTSKQFNKDLQSTGKKTKHEQVFAVMDEYSQLNTSKPKREAIQKTLSHNAKIKETINQSARQVSPGTHECLNAASTTDFGMATALGLTQMERTAKGKKHNQQIPISYLIQKQRLPTSELQTHPKKVKDLTKKQQALFDKKDADKHAFDGHIPASKVEQNGVKHPIVSKDMASRSGIHKEQLEAQQKSHHHLSLSRRDSKILDKHQASGADILEAFDNGGFSKKASWNGYTIKSAKDALKVALKTEFNYKKRQTHEKKLRALYADTASVSESYHEISSDSETGSEANESFKDFVRRKVKEKPFVEFIRDHNLKLR